MASSSVLLGVLAFLAVALFNAEGVLKKPPALQMLPPAPPPPPPTAGPSAIYCVIRDLPAAANDRTKLVTGMSSILQALGVDSQYLIPGDYSQNIYIDQVATGVQITALLNDNSGSQLADLINTKLTASMISAWITFYAPALSRSNANFTFTAGDMEPRVVGRHFFCMGTGNNNMNNVPSLCGAALPPPPPGATFKSPPPPPPPLQSPPPPDKKSPPPRVIAKKPPPKSANVASPPPSTINVPPTAAVTKPPPKAVAKKPPPVKKPPPPKVNSPPPKAPASPDWNNWWNKSPPPAVVKSPPPPATSPPPKADDPPPPPDWTNWWARSPPPPPIINGGRKMQK